MTRMIPFKSRSCLAGPWKRQPALAVVLALLALAAPLPAQSAGSLNFLVISDWGGKGGTSQVAVARQMGRTAAARKSSFVITCGDNYHANGISSEHSPRWKTEFEDIYKAPSLVIPWYASLGNHDNRGNADAEIAYSKLSPRWRMPARYYTHTERIDEANEVLFVHLDTSPFVTAYHKKGSSYHVKGQDPKAQARWLDSVLAASPACWKFVVGHHPIYAAAGTHGDTKELVADVLPLLEKHGVQVYFCGHDHVLQHLVRGKVNFFVCGGGSRPRAVQRRSDVRFGAGSLGFLSMTVSAAEARAAYINEKGEELYQTSIPAR